MGKPELKNIDVVAKFSNFQVINKDFTRCRCNVFYTGRNRNYSDITKEALQKLIARKGYANVPVVAHLMKDDDGKYYIGGHDSKIILSNEGIDIVNECVPFGVIPEDCNPSMDLITERSGEQREYFSVDIILWTHRYPIMEAAYGDEIYFNQSMEINFDDYEIDGDYTVIKDFSLSALCLLRRSLDASENIEPCFESSKVKAFSINEDKFKENFELMLNTLKQYESSGNSAVQKTNENQSKGGKEMAFGKYVEALSSVTFTNSADETVCKYRLLDVNENQLYVLDMEDYVPYSLDYAVTEEGDVETVAIDFNSKTEMSLSATEKIADADFEAVSIQSIIDVNVNSKLDEQAKVLEGEFDAKISELQQPYEDLSASYQVALKKLEEYEAKEKVAQAEQHKADVETVFEEYSAKLGKYAEFLVYKAKTKPEDVTVDEVREKLTLMAGKFMMESHGKKTFSYNPVEAGAERQRDTGDTSRYGHLLSKYSK